MTKPEPPLVLSSGEPAGIGPDLCIRLAQEPATTLPSLVILADSKLLRQRAELMGVTIQLAGFNEMQPAVCGDGLLTVLDCPTACRVEPGKLNTDNAQAVIDMLDLATEGCLSGRFSGLVTGPVQKSIINDAGIPFSGHTEHLAMKSNTEQVVMMLASENLRVALVTTHIPLADVSGAVTPALLKRVIEILHHDLCTRFQLSDPKILVCGLNPHAGEQGHLGREEIETISPVLNALRETGMKLAGPLPADTLFTPGNLKGADAVLAMYHDQGLPVLKYQGFGKAVNITLGLPFIRTSVDHGTALDLAGSGRASHSSLLCAINQAATLAWPR